jgi:hypothetical protein
LKLKTHNAFSIGILTVIGSFFTSPLLSLISASLLALMANQIIDMLGHSKNAKGYIVRTPLTHTMFRSILWGLIPAAILFLVFRIARHYPAFHIPDGYPYWILLQGIFAGPLHMSMDIITEGGIFFKKNGKFKRYALAHIAYNDPFWNMFFQIIGIALVFLIFYLKGIHGGHYGRIV